jgi:DHA1 family multidrug resistance protein-like MFS transporter
MMQGSGAAAGAVGALLLGRASDRAGDRKVLTICALASAALHVPQFFVANTTQLLILQTLSGLAAGGTITALSTTLAALAPPGREGSVYGLDATVASVANGAGPMIGTALAVGWGLRAPFLLTGALFSVAGIVTARVLRISE